jgi:hypothetical protein
MVVPTATTILPNDDPNWASKCTKNGIFTKSDTPNLLAAITPDKLTQAYVDARYFERNVAGVRSCWIAPPSRVERQVRVKHTSMSIWGMATVRILTGRSASTEWLASAVTSTYLVIRQGLRLLKQVLTICGSWNRSP